MNRGRRWFSRALALVALGSLATPLRAQSGPMRLMVGFTAGSIADLVAHALAEQFRRAFDVSVTVDNRPGLNGRSAARSVQDAPPDGNMLLVTPSSSLVLLPHVDREAGFTPVDFVPLAQLVENDFAIAIGAQHPAANLKEYASWCIAHPALAMFVTPGTGSVAHLLAAQLARALEMSAAHTPYSSINFALNDMAAGQISCIVAPTYMLVQPMRAATVRVLATSGQSRATAMPSVSTLRELGLDGITHTEAVWLLASAGTPEAIASRVSAAALAALKSVEMGRVISGPAQEAPLAARELAVRMRQLYEERGAVVRALGFNAQS